MSGPDDLDQLVRRLDPDRWLSSRFIADRGMRADVVALYALDHELARAGLVASNPLIAEMRLVWWREVLDEMFERRPVRAQPTARALADAVDRRRLAREPLDDMVEGRVAALHGDLAGIEQAGSGVARAAAAVLDERQPDWRDALKVVAELGALWARLASERGGNMDLHLHKRLIAALRSSRRLPARLLPAVLHLALAAPELAGRRPSGFEARLRLVWASLAGRL